MSERLSESSVERLSHEILDVSSSSWSGSEEEDDLTLRESNFAQISLHVHKLCMCSGLIVTVFLFHKQSSFHCSQFNPFHFTNSSYRLQVVTYVAPYNPICPSLFQVSLLHPLLHKPPEQKTIVMVMQFIIRVQLLVTVIEMKMIHQRKLLHKQRGDAQAYNGTVTGAQYDIMFDVLAHLKLMDSPPTKRMCVSAEKSAEGRVTALFVAILCMVVLPIALAVMLQRHEFFFVLDRVSYLPLSLTIFGPEIQNLDICKTFSTNVIWSLDPNNDEDI
ncbi:hypothetical protein C0J52_09273 [Blattella germanica]|nr:hypothetical protein C0J52_09273 [Blattella germanica]